MEHQFPILLEMMLEDESEAGEIDRGALGMMVRAIVGDLRQSGYAVEPAHPGRRGGEMLFQVITQIVQMAQTVGSDIYAQHDVINVISDLCTIFASVSPIALHIYKTHEKMQTTQSSSQNAQSKPVSVPIQQSSVKISVMIDGAPIAIEAADINQAEAALKLAQRFHSIHPAIKVTQKSQVKIRTAVHRKQRR